MQAPFTQATAPNPSYRAQPKPPRPPKPPPPLTPQTPRSTFLLPPDVGPRTFPKEIVPRSRVKGDHMKHVLAAVLCQSNRCHPEAAESRSASQRLPTKDLCTSWTEENRVPHLSRSLREVG
jgi:hypothetical protein